MIILIHSNWTLDQEKPFTCPETGITSYGDGIVTASLRSIRAPFICMSDTSIDYLKPKDKVAYQIIESDVTWWVTGVVARVNSDNTVDVQDILKYSFREGTDRQDCSKSKLLSLGLVKAILVLRRS